MGTTDKLPKEPQGKLWSYDFKSESVEGTISVGFNNLQKDLAVIFKPFVKGTPKPPKSTPLIGIQLFSTSGSKNPFPTGAVELTKFGTASKLDDDRRLYLTIKYTELSETVIKKIYLSSVDGNGGPISTTIDLAAPKDSITPPFVYTVKKAKTSKPQLVLAISEWPEGDPLISHG
ncbi:MAG: hypothetical protein A3J97_00025 [Spirochaetes bacterium RIFOXYC1_FULL_54_7]|nr:MAG: hypothetical protein A3J97_00025 [Spirochaetes bacterium RIFOXYC1_FULL_54_7]